jgi:hypothetical protein
MTTLTIRQKLIRYLAEADDSKIKAIYTLLKNEIEEEKAFKLTDEELEMLESEHEMHINGLSKSYTREEASQIIKGQRAS